MNVNQYLWKMNESIQEMSTNSSISPTLLFAFGNKEMLSKENNISKINNLFTNVPVLFGSTAGEICNDSVYDESISIVAIELEKSEIKTHTVKASSFKSSSLAGKSLIENFPSENLKHVFVLSDGQFVNGSELVKGIQSELPKGVSLTGGLCGDGANFNETLLGFNEAKSENICAVAFYGDSFSVGYGSMGGWDVFGPKRKVTKSTNNVLYELDGKSALDLYKDYLGEQAKQLPSSGLLFPLSLTVNEGDAPLVRTILNIDEKEKSMTFAGDLPEGATVQLMKANFDRLIDGASKAASRSLIDSNGTELAILISCVGRKLVLGQRIDEEIESVKEVLNNETIITGFYSYGEISPFTPNAKCELHNQTMTITVISEN